MRWSCRFSLTALWLLLTITHAHALPARKTPEISPTLKRDGTKVGSEYQSRQYDRNDAAYNAAISGQISSAQAKAEREQFEQQIRIQRRVARFTGALVLVGAFQFLAALIYAIVAYCQLRIINKQALYMGRANVITRGNLRASVRNAKAAIENADAAKQQAITLEKTLAATEKAAIAAQQTAESARRALNANRPYLMVINEKLQNFGVALAKDTKIHIAFMLKNCGKSPAIVSTIHARP